MEPRRIQSLWTHVAATSVAFFLGLSVGPFWSRHILESPVYVEHVSLWSALAALPRYAVGAGIVGTTLLFSRENGWILLAGLGTGAILGLLMYPIARLTGGGTRENVVSAFIVALLLSWMATVAVP
jgi:hypothetical protein